MIGRSISTNFCNMHRNDVTPMMATRSTTVDMAVKWCLSLRKLIEFAHGGFLWNFLQKPH
jgi:hypothetical protein